MAAKRPPAFFIADNPGLNFLNSIAVTVDTEVEWIASGEDLLAWLKQAELVPDAVLEGLRNSAGPGELDAVAAQARALRDWFKAFVTKHMGRPLEPHAVRELDPLNQLLARDEEFGQIVVRGRPREDRHNRHNKKAAARLDWCPQRRWRTPGSLLLPLARVLADLVCTENFTLLKACQGPTCTLLFLDRTRGSARRWCSMGACGNRAKQAAHRKRARQARK